MRLFQMLILTGLTLFTMTPSATAQRLFSLGPQVGGMGVGAAAMVKLGGFLSVSGEFGVLPLNNIDLTESDIDYTVDPNIRGVVLSINWHPLRNNFMLGVGMMFGGYALHGESESLSGTVAVGDDVYTVDDVGTLIGDFTLEGPGPVFSLGWRGNGFNFGLGVALIGATEVSLEATGRLNEDPQFLADLERERKQLENDLDFPFVPFLRLGWQFGF